MLWFPLIVITLTANEAPPPKSLRFQSSPTVLLPASTGVLQRDGGRGRPCGKYKDAWLHGNRLQEPPLAQSLPFLFDLPECVLRVPFSVPIAFAITLLSLH